MSGPTGSYSANGAGPTGLATILDGVSIQDIATNSGTVQMVNQEMIQEIKATTSTFSAEYAKGPAVLNANTKAGGNAYHGDGYMYYPQYGAQLQRLVQQLSSAVAAPGNLLLSRRAIGRPTLDSATRISVRTITNSSSSWATSITTRISRLRLLGSWVPTMAERKGDFSQQSLNSELCGARPDGGQNLNSVRPCVMRKTICPTALPSPTGT